MIIFVPSIKISNEEISSELCLNKRRQLNEITEVSTSCFSREEFFGSFALEKGDS